MSLPACIVSLCLYIYQEVFQLEKTDLNREGAAKTRACSEEAAAGGAGVKKKAAAPSGAGPAGASLDDITALKVSLTAAESIIDYPLPPIIGD